MKDARSDLVKAADFPPVDSVGKSISGGRKHGQRLGKHKIVVVDAMGQLARTDAVKATLSSTRSLRRFGKTSAFQVGETVVIVDKAHVTSREKRALSRRALIRRLREKATTADSGGTIDTTGMSDEEFIALLRR